MDPDRRRDAFQLGRAPVLRDEQPRQQPQRRIADYHRVGLGEGLEPRGHVEGVAQRQRLLPLPTPHLAHHHGAGVDAHAGLKTHSVLRLQPGIERGELVQHLAARPHRPLRVVLVGLRVAEVDEQPVAQVLGDTAVVAPDRVCAARLVDLHHAAVSLGVEPLRETGRVHQVAEHHRQVPMLAALRERPRRRGFLGRFRQLPAHRDRIERLDQRLDRDVAPGGLARRDRFEQRPQAMAAKPRRDLDGAPAREQPFHRPRLLEGTPPRQTLQEDQPPGVEIRARRRGLTDELLGRGVEGCPQELPRLGQRLPLHTTAARGQPSQAEVQHQCIAARPRPAQHEVRGLEIPVDDALRVGAGQRVEHLRHQPNGLANAEGSFARQGLLQRLAGDVLEDRVELPGLRLARVEQAYDVRMRERGADPGLAAEALGLAAGRGLGPLAWTQQLDRHRLPRRELARLVHLAEAARPQLSQDLVAILEKRSARRPGGLAVHHTSGPGAYCSPPGRAETLILRNARAECADSAISMSPPQPATAAVRPFTPTDSDEAVRYGDADRVAGWWTNRITQTGERWGDTP
jgi:hypothetical protein